MSVPPAQNGSTQTAELTKNGYNLVTISTKIQPNAPAVAASLTPTGKVYFLSKLSGKIDVVKTNLDGSLRQTVLAGTGREDNTGTVLLASRDWKYLALLSVRDTSGRAQLNLIDTSNDQLTNIDKGAITIDVTGWIGHSFVYRVDRDLELWQSQRSAIKSYNADNKQLATIDQTAAQGDQYNYAGESIDWISQVADKIVYFKHWTFYHTYLSSPIEAVTGKQAVIISSSVAGSKTTIKSYPLVDTADGGVQINPLTSYNAVLYKPTQVYFATYAGPTPTYYEYDSGHLNENDKDAKDYFATSAVYPTYLQSPSGNQTFWSESRDGKNTLFTGSTTADNGHQIATLSDYDSYGWFTDDYLLVSKAGSELYIMPAAGGKPIKISDYHKPSQDFSGYGGGYGAR